MNVNPSLKLKKKYLEKVGRKLSAFDKITDFFQKRLLKSKNLTREDLEIAQVILRALREEFYKERESFKKNMAGKIKSPYM